MPGGGTDLSVVANTTDVTITSSTGNDAVVPAASSGTAGVLTASDKIKLDGITAGATIPTYDTVPAGTMFAVNESSGTYIRPSSRSDIIFVFTGVSDPASVALENDRWERLS